MTSSSNIQNPISNQWNQGPSANTILVPEEIIGQDINSSDANAQTPDRLLVKGKLADTTQSFAGMSQVKVLGAPLLGHADSVRSVAISPDGSRIVSGPPDKAIRVWDAETNKALGAPLLGHADYVQSVAISPDGSRIVSGSHDKTIRVWDAETGKALGVPLQCFDWFPNLMRHFLRDGNRIVSNSLDKVIRVWDLSEFV